MIAPIDAGIVIMIRRFSAIIGSANKGNLFSAIRTSDSYMVVAPPTAALALAGLSRALEPLGLELSPSKTMVWALAGASSLPAELLPNYVSALPVLGTHLRSPGDADNVPFLLGHLLFGNDP